MATMMPPMSMNNLARRVTSLAPQSLGAPAAAAGTAMPAQPVGMPARPVMGFGGPGFSGPTMQSGVQVQPQQMPQQPIQNFANNNLRARLGMSTL